MDKTGDGINFLKTKFPRLSEAKIKEGISVGPQIRQLFKDSTLMKHLNRKEKRAWLAFKNASMLAEYWWSLVRKLQLHGTRGKQAPDEAKVQQRRMQEVIDEPRKAELSGCLGKKKKHYEPSITNITFIALKNGAQKVPENACVNSGVVFVQHVCRLMLS
ncbi:hypothetical protein AVEN_272261-1 [Araneus ventricosus]|uniref:Uncharacterized protein n=1 Tax=Araneus ventricosus TaxID=182803 RepID=A0A4Y2MFL4_ARAVE|nr:hypothetical protein AVEN_272261-1 [Araneus ventricosus]